MTTAAPVPIEQFQQKCERFCVRELRQNKALEHLRDSEKSGYALEYQLIGLTEGGGVGDLLVGFGSEARAYSGGPKE